MELAWFDPIALDCGNEQYLVSSFVRPPRNVAPDFELLARTEAVWALDGLLASHRTRLLSSLRSAVHVPRDRHWWEEALRREVERGTIDIRRRVVRAIVGSGVPNTEAPPPPALGPDDAPKKTWFEVKVVDIYGKPVDGTEVLFTQGAQKEKAKTNGNGVARWTDVDGSSFASVKLAKPDDLREALKDRWGKSDPAEGLEGDKLSIYDDDLSSSLIAEAPSTLILFKPLTRVRLIGMHFDTNKCFLREPAMNGIRKVVSIYDASPTGKLLVVGHTDTTGDDAYNLDLSVERAEAVKAYLKNDVAAWEAWFAGEKPKQKRWGSGEVSHMIGALPCEQTVAGFQRWSNDTRGTDLEVDGVAGPKTRKALIEAYMAIDGTTLPESIDVVVHGCGEFFPCTDKGDQFGKDGVDAEEDRRVEIFCFPDEIQPPVPGKKASKGEPEYPAWEKQITENVDVSEAIVLQPFEFRLQDHDHTPMKQKHFLLEASGVETTGLTDDDGTIKTTLPNGTEKAKLRVWVDEYPDGEFVDIEVEIDDLPGIDTGAGAARRLANLGYLLYSDYEAPPAPTSAADVLAMAIGVFQSRVGLSMTSELDAPTKSRLEALHPG